MTKFADMTHTALACWLQRHFTWAGHKAGNVEMQSAISEWAARVREARGPHQTCITSRYMEAILDKCRMA